MCGCVGDVGSCECQAISNGESGRVCASGKHQAMGLIMCEFMCVCCGTPLDSGLLI